MLGTYPEALVHFSHGSGESNLYSALLPVAPGLVVMGIDSTLGLPNFARSHTEQV